MYLLPPRYPLYNIQVMSDYSQCVFQYLRLGLLSGLNGIKRIFINLNYKKSLSVSIYTREYLVAKSEITIGDKFAKVHAPRLAWTVTNIKKNYDELPHAILVQEGLEGRQILISFLGLEIKSLYTKLPI